MIKILRINILLIVITFLITNYIYSQNITQNKNKLQKIAYEYFNNEEYSKALPLLLKLDSLTPNNFEVKYYIGACYLNTPYEKTKGIPYLEFALEKGGNLLPNVVFYDLGTLYHLNYQFDDAIKQFKRFKEISTKTDLHFSSTERMITICNNAKEIYANQLQAEIFNLSTPVNTDNSETTPFISADEEILYFTRSFSKTYEQIDIEYLKKIYCSILLNKKWQEPFEIPIEAQSEGIKVTLAGISPDGENLYLSIGNEVSADIYSCKIVNGKISEYNKLPEIINSQSWEGKVSITPDAQELYFSSNRPGGFGGKDLYKVTKNESGNWANLQNLGPSVNTEYDEDAPFIHPDNITLYFSSNGHATMGGFDIFSCTKIDSSSNWTEPTNFGYPINTTSDDIGFVISADGNTAYLSSAHDNIFGKHDIYKVVLHKTIPLTLIKGVILGGEPAKPIKAKIKVVDHETKERLRYIYNPNPKTGKYLMIFPPNKNYDMVVEAEGYYPQLINVFVPNQTYFYELFQEIYLKQIKINENDSVIGQEIKITNTFYDIYKTEASNNIINGYDTLQIHKFDDLLQTVENIINTTDSIGLKQLDILSEKDINNNNGKINKSKEYNKLLDLIETAIEKTDSVSLLLVDANTVYNDITNKVFFFGVDKDLNSLKPVIIGVDTIYTLPSINTNNTKNVNISKLLNIKDTIKTNTEKQIDFKSSSENTRKYIYLNSLYYEIGKSDIEKKYIQTIEGIVKLMLLNKNLGIEIHGYADKIGSEESNFELSKIRAFNVMENLVLKQVESRRIIMTAHGEIGNQQNDKEMQLSRKVEIKIFEVPINE